MIITANSGIISSNKLQEITKLRVAGAQLQEANRKF
jgi:hypothetical protein